MTASDESTPGRRSARSGPRHEVIAAGIAVAAFVAYLPALWSGFTGDDFFILARLKHLGGLTDPLAYFTQSFFDYYRPIGFVSHAVDLELWGLTAAGFHLTNLGLHTANAVLVFLLGRRVLNDVTGAALAALLFALHPASHEVAYWMAARFDLLATFFGLLAVLFLRHERPATYAAGVVAFALALFSKESALAVILIAPAYDVMVAQRDWRATVRRIAPLVVVAAIYAVLRSQSANLAVAGGVGKLPKILMVAGALAGLIWISRGARARRDASDRWRPGWPMIAVAGAVILAALFLPGTSQWMREKVGFIAFAVFYLLSPVVLPPPPPVFFEPPAAAYGLVGAAVVMAGLATWRVAGAWLRGQPGGAFLLTFVAAALLPVSSMTGGTRYLYLASAGVSLLLAAAFRSWSRHSPMEARVALVVVVLLSGVQLAMAARAWRWASAMTSDGLALMSASLEPCRKRDIILLTAPVGIRGTYCNFYWDAFDATTDCPPASFLTMLRVVRLDADVEVRDRGNGVLELWVPHYAGQFVASTDLRNFDRPIQHEATWSLDTPIGRLDTRPEESAPDGPTQIFRVTLTPQAQQAGIFYYSAGRVWRLR